MNGKRIAFSPLLTRRNLFIKQPSKRDTVKRVAATKETFGEQYFLSISHKEYPRKQIKIFFIPFNIFTKLSKVTLGSDEYAREMEALLVESGSGESQQLRLSCTR